MSRHDNQIRVESLVMKDGFAPRVGMKWGKESGMVPPVLARLLALQILRAAIAAEFDSALAKTQLAQAMNRSDQTRLINRLNQLRLQPLSDDPLLVGGEPTTVLEAVESGMGLVEGVLRVEFESALIDTLHQFGVDAEGIESTLNTMRQAQGMEPILVKPVCVEDN